MKLIKIKHLCLKMLIIMMYFIITGCSAEDKQVKQGNSNATFSIRFIDVGQGDAALIECDQHYMLIDGGSAKNSDNIYTILKDSNISHLDLIVATHPDEDHVGGLAGALNYATASLVLCSDTFGTSRAFENFKKYAEKNGGGIVVPTIGDQYQLGSSEITILGVNAGSESNDSSIVLKIQHGENSFLFTGDAELEAERALLEGNADLSADVLKVAYHGSNSSSSKPFLTEVMPSYAVISVGKANDYLHPASAVLDRLGEIGAQIYRTDLHGEILVISDGKKITVSNEKNVTKEENSQNYDSTEKNDYILNKKTKKFHNPNCESVKQMKENNKIYFNGTRDEVISNGYDACGNCHP